MKLSVLDQTPVIHGHRVADAVAATVELAQAADDLGYTRFWCAEHHGLLGVANPCPEVMLARLGSVTRRIRLGSGGVMLPYYSPFKVAEQFLMLEALFPNRIDLGVGRAPGGGMATARAVSHGRYDPDAFPQQVADLVTMFDGLMPDSIAPDVVLQPSVDTRPELWVLGSSDFGGRLAGRLGLRHAFAHFIAPHGADESVRLYREEFERAAAAGDVTGRPYCAIALFVICADTEAEARALAAAVDLRRVQMAYGINAPIPSLEQAAGWEPDMRARMVIDRERPRGLIGTPEQVCERMVEARDRFRADEVMVLTVAASYAARLRSYELLARAFGLQAGTA